jgi:transposase-like protein
MARNLIQMQRGMSLSELYRQYGTEAQCEAAIVDWRWPNGFECPRCGAREHAIVGKRRLFNCHGCQAQTSIKAGTIFERTLLPLTKWFQGKTTIAGQAQRAALLRRVPIPLQPALQIGGPTAPACPCRNPSQTTAL